MPTYLCFSMHSWWFSKLRKWPQIRYSYICYCNEINVGTTIQPQVGEPFIETLLRRTKTRNSVIFFFFH